jgi:hypothetical protein
MRSLGLIWTLLGFVALFGGCGGRAHEWYPSHAVAPPPGQTDDREWHSCKRPGMSCPEGWACVKRGCEWCGPGDETRCAVGNDG